MGYPPLTMSLQGSQCLQYPLNCRKIGQPPAIVRHVRNRIKNRLKGALDTTWQQGRNTGEIGSVRVLVKKNLLGGSQREEQRSRLTGQRTKSKALLESDGLIVLGIRQKRERGGVRLQRSGSGIGKRRPAQTAPLKSVVHGEAPDANSGHGGIAR